MFDGKYFDWNQKRIKSIVDHYGYKFFYGKKIADLGCGYADLSGTLYRLGADITAVDVRQDHLKVVSKKFPGIKVIRANLEGQWPFFGTKFDIIMDLGLVCHLASVENHLKSVCSSTTYLILETAVCDSDDPNKVVQVSESKDVYDLSFSGTGSRPSPALIERILTNCGMTFRRMDNSKFNSGEYKYDWVARNDGSTDIHKRRIWFAVKSEAGIVMPYQGTRPANFTKSSLILPQQPMNANLKIIINKEILYNVYTTKPKFLYLAKQPNMINISNALRKMNVSLLVFYFEEMWQYEQDAIVLQKELLHLIQQFNPQFINTESSDILKNIMPEVLKLSPNTISIELNNAIKTNIIEQSKVITNITFDQLKGILTYE